MMGHYLLAMQQKASVTTTSSTQRLAANAVRASARP
jgi:hypothetical protein